MSDLIGTPLTSWQTAKLLGVEIARLTRGLLARKKRRDPSLVSHEYDKGAWSRQLGEKAWMQHPNLASYVSAGDDQFTVAKIENVLVNVSKKDYYKFRTKKIQEVLTEFAGDTSELIELGSGFGMNLFTLSLTNHWKRLKGFELSENGLNAANEIARYFQVQNIEFHSIDLTKNHPSFQALSGSVCFTYLCLEQLKYETTRIVQRLIDAKVRRCIHIEPSFEMLNILSPKDLVNYLYVKRHDYQDNLLWTLRKFEKDGAIKIKDVRRLYYAPTHRNDPTLICWESVVN